MSHYILSASMKSDEPDPNAVPGTVVTPGYQHSQFVPPGHAPGGNVTFGLAPAAAPTDARPLAVHAYIVPASDLPGDLSTLTTDFFMNRGDGPDGNPLPPFATAGVPIPADGGDGNSSVAVPNYPFGPVFVQLIDEYSS